jgi:Kazal-type serine protease inhibitor domain
LLVLTFALSLSTGASAVGLGQTCGGLIGIPCDAGLWCQKPPNTCRIFDGFGKCARVPKFCFRIFRPVCGCDGKTYPNDCVRQRAQVQLAHTGRCRSPY